MTDTTDHTISKPCEPEARIRESEFKTLLDQVYAVLDEEDYLFARAMTDHTDLAKVPPFDTWIRDWNNAS